MNYLFASSVTIRQISKMFAIKGILLFILMAVFSHEFVMAFCLLNSITINIKLQKRLKYKLRFDNKNQVVGWSVCAGGRGRDEVMDSIDGKGKI